MDIEKLIEQLNARGLGNGTSLGYHSGLFDEAANAIETLQAENEKLRTELEQVKAERDAAVKDLNEFLSLDELCPIQCKWCKWENTNCDGKIPEWRSQKED